MSGSLAGMCPAASSAATVPVRSTPSSAGWNWIAAGSTAIATASRSSALVAWRHATVVQAVRRSTSAYVRSNSAGLGAPSKKVYAPLSAAAAAKSPHDSVRTRWL